MRILVLGWVWLACWVNQFKIHSESVAYRKASWSLKTRRLRWTQISALITVIICGSGNIFSFFIAVDSIVYYWFGEYLTNHLLWMIMIWCEHSSQQETDFYQISNRIINQEPSVGFWLDFENDKLKIFWKIRARSNRIELDQIWFSCLNRIFVIFTEFLRSFGQKVKTFWVSMPFDTFPNQIHYESILDFPWYTSLFWKLLGL